MLSKVPSKLDLLLAAATLAALIGFAERGHSIVIDPPDQVALELPTPCVDAEQTRGDTSPAVFPEDLFVSGLLGQPLLATQRWSCEQN